MSRTNFPSCLLTFVNYINILYIPITQLLKTITHVIREYFTKDHIDVTELVSTGANYIDVDPAHRLQLQGPCPLQRGWYGPLKEARKYI